MLVDACGVAALALCMGCPEDRLGEVWAVLRSQPSPITPVLAVKQMGRVLAQMGIVEVGSGAE